MIERFLRNSTPEGEHDLVIGRMVLDAMDMACRANDLCIGEYSTGLQASELGPGWAAISKV